MVLTFVAKKQQLFVRYSWFFQEKKQFAKNENLKTSNNLLTKGRELE